MVVESDEEPEEPDAEDDFEFSEHFKGDQVARTESLGQKGLEALGV